MTYTASLSVEGGPAESVSDHFDSEATDKIEALIPKGSVETTVNVQPGAVADMQAIIVTADDYIDLTFKVDSEVTVHTLDGPLMLVGPGNIALLGATCLALKFTNANALVDRNVTILVARTAT